MNFNFKSTIRYPQFFQKRNKKIDLTTLDSEINIRVRLLIFEKKIEGKKMKNDFNALFDVKMN